MDTEVLAEQRLFNRLKAKLYRKTGEILRRCREDSRDFHNLGAFFITNERNWVIEKDVCLDCLERRLA